MTVKRIVANLRSDKLAEAKVFYQTIFGLDVLMDQGWIQTYGSGETMSVQLSIMEQGGSDTEVPDISVEVDDLEAVLRKAEVANIDIEYGPVDEPWGVSRFYIRDPMGKLLNVMMHAS